MPGISAAINRMVSKARGKELKKPLEEHNLDQLKNEFGVESYYDACARFQVFVKDPVVYNMDIDDWKKIKDSPGCVQLVIEQMALLAKDHYRQKPQHKTKPKAQATAHLDDRNCPGCGAPIVDSMLRCEYCNRPLQSFGEQVLRHFSYRNGIKTRDGVISITTTV